MGNTRKCVKNSHAWQDGETPKKRELCDERIVGDINAYYNQNQDQEISKNLGSVKIRLEWYGLLHTYSIPRNRKTLKNR